MVYNKFYKAFNYWLYPILGGLIFLACFNAAYSQINPDWFLLRDDGVITFSHAKNLVNYGFIGVNPSGERLEGFSAPIQFFVFAIAYFFGAISYEVFTLWQTQIATFLLGCIFIAYFLSSPKFALLATILAACGLTLSTSFFEWHASGMENAFTHVLFAGSVFLLFYFSTIGQIKLNWFWVFLFASLSRLDGIYHILPLLLIFAIYWLHINKNYRGFTLLLTVVALWVGYHAWRFYYFGSLASNTMLAQNIQLMDRIQTIFTLRRWYFIDSWPLLRQIFDYHLGYFIAIFLPLAFFVNWNRSRALLLCLSLSLIITAWANPLFFGETRLDPTRSTTQMAFFVLVASFCIIQGIRSNWLKAFALVISLPILIFLRTPPYYLCCGVSSFEQIKNDLLSISEKEKIFRPTIANPDLGLISWEKKFNVIDLGMLGSSIFSKVRQGPLLADYFFDYAAPDFIESHETWSCHHWQTIFADPRFRSQYVPIHETTVQYGSCGNTNLPKGIWIRRAIQKESNSAERRLLDDLDKSLSVERLRLELKECQSTFLDPKDCTYVARSAYRRLPEFIKNDEVNALSNIFFESRSKAFDEYLLNGYRNAQAHQGVLIWLANRYLTKHHELISDSQSKFKVGLDHGYIVFIKQNCDSRDLKNPFFVEYVPKTTNSDKQKNTKLSFNFLQNGFHTSQICMATVPIKSDGNQVIIEVGQWQPKQNQILWKLTLPESMIQ